jgi:hypothetical protein
MFAQVEAMDETITLYRPVGPRELALFNQNIVGLIEVIGEYRHGEHVDRSA